jgi:hypothetical protein
MTCTAPKSLTLSQLRLSGQAAKSAQPSPVKGEGIRLLAFLHG